MNGHYSTNTELIDNCDGRRITDPRGLGCGIFQTVDESEVNKTGTFAAGNSAEGKVYSMCVSSSVLRHDFSGFSWIEWSSTDLGVYLRGTVPSSVGCHCVECHEYRRWAYFERCSERLSEKSSTISF